MNIPKSSTELTKKLNINEYQLVVLINKRVRELMYGAKPLIDDKKGSLIDIAISEILSGKIKPQIPSE